MRSRYVRVIVVALVLLSATASGCGAGATKSTGSAPVGRGAAPKPSITSHASLDGSTLNIEGETTLPDGEKLVLAVAAKPPAPARVVVFEVEVANGRFDTTVELGAGGVAWPAGPFTVWVYQEGGPESVSTLEYSP